MRYVEMLQSVVVAVFRTAVGIAFLVLIVSVLWQVIGRLTGNSPVWTEELTRFALLYLAAIGAGLSLRTGELVNVDVVVESLPERAAWWLRLISAGLVAILGLYLAPMAWQFVSIGWFQSSPALRVSMGWVHMSMFLMLALLAFFAILRIVAMVAGTSDGRPIHSPTDEEI